MKRGTGIPATGLPWVERHRQAGDFLNCVHKFDS
jgi:hypothetical protein